MFDKIREKYEQPIRTSILLSVFALVIACVSLLITAGRNAC